MTQDLVHQHHKFTTRPLLFPLLASYCWVSVNSHRFTAPSARIICATCPPRTQRTVLSSESAVLATRDADGTSAPSSIVDLWWLLCEIPASLDYDGELAPKAFVAIFWTRGCFSACTCSADHCMNFKTRSKRWNSEKQTSWCPEQCIKGGKPRANRLLLFVDVHVSTDLRRSTSNTRHDTAISVK